MANLTKLVTVDLHDNQIIDVGPLAKLQVVSLLNFSKNRIADLGPLVDSCKADAAGAKRFAPYLRLYLAGNPVLTDAAKKGQLDALKAAGVRLEDVR
jgi:hypothetical protein